MATFALITFTGFCTGIYTNIYIMYVLIIGKINNPEIKDIALELKNTINTASWILFKHALISAFWICLLTYLLTRPKVKEQFK